MIPRYSRPIMKKIWDEENKFKIWFEIEAHAADGMASNGTIPKEAAKKIWELGIFEIDVELEFTIASFKSFTQDLNIILLSDTQIK